jgi:NodT family efflux transporter outer membrane factor (OMF) lipoprotein
MRSKWSAARVAAASWLALLGAGCVPGLQREPREAVTSVPDTYGGPAEALNSGALNFKEFFTDPKLTALIDLALEKNQELNIALLEIDVAQSEVLAREGEYLPRVGLVAGAGLEKVGEDTRHGRVDEALDLREHLPDFVMGLSASWELDIWGKLRTAKEAAATRYLATIEGRRFLVTVLVAEVADSYYELLALDGQLAVLQQNIELQQTALDVVRLQKQVGRVTELAVKRFEAEVLKNRSRLYQVQQQIIETENRLNFLVGRFGQPVERDARDLMARAPTAVHTGLPSQLLENRPDVKQAELELEAAKLDVEVARTSFYPSLEINAGVVYNTFKAATLVDTPASLAYLLAAEVTQPLWNRKELTAGYFSANSKQLQAVFDYERTILQAFNEVANQLTMVQNMESSYQLRAQEVERLSESIAISADLFKSARADYMEVLLTRRDALDAQMELIETRRQQLGAMVRLYRALGGGWR